MTTITATYCAFCELTAKVFRGMIETCESIGNARAAHELTRMGLHKEAKALMTRRNHND
tara:strand:+ start:638 stop:814 length:177 start_codon:yes stop_codon:yes gene_type:complete